MKIAKATLLLLSTICLVDPTQSKGQLLDGTSVGTGNKAHPDENAVNIDNIQNLKNTEEEYKLLLKKTGGIQNGEG